MKVNPHNPKMKTKELIIKINSRVDIKQLLKPVAYFFDEGHDEVRRFVLLVILISKYSHFNFFIYITIKNIQFLF